MNEQDFYLAVSDTEFCSRYYALCERFPIHDLVTPPISHATLAHSLSDLGRVMHYDKRDNSYSSEELVNNGTRHIGFVIQRTSIIEFWYWLDMDEERFGSNFAVIAHEATMQSGRAILKDPYPRPVLHDAQDLKLVLTECFDLADLLDAVCQRLCE